MSIFQKYLEMTFAKTALSSDEAIQISKRIGILKNTDPKEMVKIIVDSMMEQWINKQKQKLINQLRIMDKDELIEQIIDDEFGNNSYRMYSDRRIVQI